jgi:hypothetical protein
MISKLWIAGMFHRAHTVLANAALLNAEPPRAAIAGNIIVALPVLARP